MMACRYFSCSRLVDSAWDGTGDRGTSGDALVTDTDRTEETQRRSFRPVVKVMRKQTAKHSKTEILELNTRCQSRDKQPEP